MKKFILILSTITVCAVLTACENTNGTEETITTMFSAETTVSETTAASGTEKATTVHTSIETKAPDKYTYYLVDYKGRNCASLGYSNATGTQIYDRDSYGPGQIRLNLIADDNSYVDVGDKDVLKNYVVTGQSIEPNTEIKFVFETDSEGKEYNSFVENQSINQIDLYVTRIESAE